jgi:hypothetical protein
MLKAIGTMQRYQTSFNLITRLAAADWRIT